MRAMIYLRDGSVIQTEDLNTQVQEVIRLTVVYASNSRVKAGVKLLIPMANISFIELL